eukprot:5406781-Pyramimonas_sp.AAC.1
MCSVAPPGGRKRPGVAVQSTPRKQPARVAAKNKAARARLDVGGAQGGNLTCTVSARRRAGATHDALTI